jgi:hypothetical protein
MKCSTTATEEIDRVDSIRLNRYGTRAHAKLLSFFSMIVVIVVFDFDLACLPLFSSSLFCLFCCHVTLFMLETFLSTTFQETRRKEIQIYLAYYTIIGDWQLRKISYAWHVSYYFFSTTTRIQDDQRFLLS